MSVKWTHEALANLDKAVKFIAENKPIAAADVARKIWNVSQLLAEQPGMG